MESVGAAARECARCPVLQATLDDLLQRHDEEVSRLQLRHDWQLQVNTIDGIGEN